MGYIKIQADEFKTFMSRLGFAQVDVVGTKELVFDRKTVEPGVVTRIFSSVTEAQGGGRDVGKDAIRVVLFSERTGRGIASVKKVYRVPGWRDRVINRIDTIRANLAPAVALASKVCPLCKGPTVRREARKGGFKGKAFLGCRAYPVCRGVINIT